jgi:tetratricopeptide (TPR) repeat protein
VSVDSQAPAEPAGTAASTVTWPVRSGLVPPLAEGFVARPESAPGLGHVLAPGACVALTPARTVRAAVAPGSPDWPGSCGKTQLAVYFAESLWKSRDLDLLVWVPATSRASILSAYTAAAAAVIGIDQAGDAETVAARFVGWLAETSRPWLVVLDDLSAPADAEGLWPAGQAGRTLVTTAGAAAAFARPQLMAFPLAGLSRREALSYLLGRLTDDRGQRTGAIDLVDLLGGEPLALSQASAVLDSSALSCRDYADHFGRKREQLAGGSQGRPAAAAISWTLSVEQAYRMLPGGPVQPVLILAAVLDGHAIAGSVFTAAAVREYAGHPGQGPTSQDGLWACVSCLATAGLLTIDRTAAPPVVRMHSSVQAAVRMAASREALGRAALTAADALLEIWPADDDSSWLADSLRSSALSIIRLAGELLWTANRHQLLFRTGRSLEGAHLTMLAAAHWNHVAAASERYLGPDHPDTLAASDHLASAFLAAGRALEALPWFRRVLADRVSLLGPEHPATTEFEVRMGRALLAAGRADEAVALFERVASDRAHLNGPAHPDTLDARDALADAYCAAGRLADGIRQYQRTLTERERGQGPTHPATMATTMKLADAYLDDGRLKESISAYKRVVSGRERRLAADHPDTIEARSRLATAYQSAGKMAIAVQLHERARDDSERVLGVDHLDTLTRQVHLAHAYYAVGRIGDAAIVLRETAERGERVLPADDPLLRTVRESLANITG